MVVTFLIALEFVLVFGQDNLLVQNQELRATGGYVCTSPWVSIGSSDGCFFFRDDRMDWNNAQTYCQRYGGNLIILDTDSKRRDMINYMYKFGLMNGRSRHLGANDRTGSWRWVNWQYVTSGWRRWKDGRADYEPDDDRGDDTCMYLYTDDYPSAGYYDLLSDYKCTTERYFVCEKKATDIDECRSGNGGCQQTCTNTRGSFTCSCSRGYSLSNDRKSCIDINECRSGNGGCQQTCTNTRGSFTCSCSRGYSLSNDRKSCTDINECLTNNGGCNQNCTNTLGSYTCSCTEGFSLNNNNMTCTDINECLTKNGGCNQNCTNILGEYTCSCTEGYHLSNDNMTCTDINECLTNNGGCNQNCTNALGSHTCSCTEGYALSNDNMTCTVLPKPCKATRKCQKAKGLCQNAKECSGKQIKNGCKGAKGCICCVDSTQPPCKATRKCNKANGICQNSTYCSGKQIKNGCKGGKGCICCVAPTM